MKPFLQNITDKIVELPQLDEDTISEIIPIVQDGLDVDLIREIFMMNEDIKFRIKIASWMHEGFNLPISAEEIKELFSSEEAKTAFDLTDTMSDDLALALSLSLPVAIDNFRKNANFDQEFFGSRQ